MIKLRIVVTNAPRMTARYEDLPMPKRTIINMKVDKAKPNLSKMRVYKKSTTIAKTAFLQLRPFHKSTRGVATPFLKMLFMIRMTERIPSPTLDQKKIKPDPGLLNVPSPKSIAMTATKIETANQNNPLTTCFRSIISPFLSVGIRSFRVQAQKIFSYYILTEKAAKEDPYPLGAARG
jgi:hypothetical protein